ncbi:MAG TPA: flavin reductase family protein [Candidatus Limnocylindria bacterium]|nr:flavin reductase family protein [Candidatus Limnocylindria bacterium]
MGFITLKPGTMLAPTPVVMVTCASEAAAPNIITLAWVGTVCSEPPMLSVSVRPHRHSYEIIRDSGEFAVNLVSRDLVKATDLCGVKSGRDGDKFALCGLTPLPLEELRFAPGIAESPAVLACRVEREVPLGSHSMFVAHILGVHVREDLADEGGKVDFGRAGLVAYSHGEYAGLSRPLGFFGFSVARPEILRRRMGKK